MYQKLHNVRTINKLFFSVLRQIWTCLRNTDSWKCKRIQISCCKRTVQIKSNLGERYTLNFLSQWGSLWKVVPVTVFSEIGDLNITLPHHQQYQAPNLKGIQCANTVKISFGIFGSKHFLIKMETSDLTFFEVLCI